MEIKLKVGSSPSRRFSVLAPIEFSHTKVQEAVSDFSAHPEVGSVLMRMRPNERIKIITSETSHIKFGDMEIYGLSIIPEVEVVKNNET